VVNDTDNFYVLKNLGTDYTDIWYHFYIRLNEVSTTAESNWKDHTVLLVYNTAGSQYYLRFYLQLDASTPKVVYRAGFYYRDAAEATQTVNSSALTPSADTWYEVKIHAKKGTSSDGVIALWWGGSQVLNSTSLTMSSNTAFAAPRLGKPIGGWGASWTSLIYYIDNFEVAETDLW
jgi:hypothetical protein